MYLQGHFGRILGREGENVKIWNALPSGSIGFPTIWYGNMGAHHTHDDNTRKRRRVVYNSNRVNDTC